MKTRFWNQLPNLTLIICYWKWITSWTLPMVWSTVWQIQPDRGIGHQPNWGINGTELNTSSCALDLKCVQMKNCLVVLTWYTLQQFWVALVMIYVLLSNLDLWVLLIFSSFVMFTGISTVNLLCNWGGGFDLSIVTRPLCQIINVSSLNKLVGL